MKKCFLWITVLLNFSLIGQDFEVGYFGFLDENQIYVYYSKEFNVTNQILYKSPNQLSLKSTCFSIEKLEESGVLYQLYSIDENCPNLSNETEIELKDSLLKLDYNLPVQEIRNPILLLGGKAAGEKINQQKLDLSVYFFSEDLIGDEFLNLSTEIDEINLTIYYKKSSKKNTENFSMEGGELTKKCQQRIEKNFDLISSIKINAHLSIPILKSNYKISSNFEF